MPPEETLRVEIESPSDHDGYPFREVLYVLSGFEHILENCVDTLLDEMEIRPETRPRLEIIGRQPRVGSYQQQLILNLESAGIVAPVIGTLLSQLTPSQILSGAKDAVDFIKWVFSKFLDTGRIPEISVADNQGFMVVARDRSTVNINNTTLQIAVKSEEDIIKVAEALRSGKIKSAQFVSSSGEFSFGAEDRRFSNPKIRRQKPVTKLLRQAEGPNRQFVAPLTLPDTRIRLIGEITSFDKRDRRGIFHVAANQDIPEADYVFEVRGTQDLDDYIIAMRDDATTVECLATQRRSRAVLLVFGIVQGQELRS